MEKNRGYSLVELMVALAVGLLIALAAGTLLLVGVGSYRQVELFSIKQSALNFSVDMMMRDVRRAATIYEPTLASGASPTLRLDFSEVSGDSGCGVGEVVERTYRLGVDSDPAGAGLSLVMEQTCDGTPDPPVTEPLVVGFSSGGLTFEKNSLDDYTYDISLCLIDEMGEDSCVDRVEFQVVNRMGVLQDE